MIKLRLQHTLGTDLFLNIIDQLVLLLIIVVSLFFITFKILKWYHKSVYAVEGKLLPYLNSQSAYIM